MYLSLNWLKDFINIPKSITPEELGEKLTMHTVEVEKIAKQAQHFDKVVVGKILEIRKHPNADRLQIALVDTGDKEPRSIVCGAPNIKVGQLVPVALPGAILPNGAEIKEAEVRGEKSMGMLCAEDELGLGEDHSGIKILDKGKPGDSFAAYLNLTDVILEVDNKSLSNRADLWGHYGIAREIGAILDLKIKPDDNDKVKLALEIKKDAKPKKLEVKVEERLACPRYMALRLDDIEIKEAPEWIRERLIAVGAKPINNIVDITNYVMLELGQPLHAFDATQAEKIIVRYAKKDELIECLDEKERKLTDKTLVIADNQKPLAIAGIIGGQNSAISEKTTAIVIEAANFDAATIRQASQKLGLRTDASMRFEKGLDPELTVTALKLAVKLIKKSCKKAKISSALVDINNSDLEPKFIDLDLDWLNNFLGEHLPQKKIMSILENLGFALAEKSANILQAKIPSWRAVKDITIPEDLAEEVARIYGFDNLPAKMPEIMMAAPEINEEHRLETKIKNILALESHLVEVYNYSFVGEDDLKKLNLDFSTYLKLANPISKNQTLLRQNLTSGLLNNLKFNQQRGENIGLFEIGYIYLNVAGHLNKDAKGTETLPHQEKIIGLALAGDYPDIFSRLKGLTENLFKSLIDYSLEIEFLPGELIAGPADKKAKALIRVLNKNVGMIFNLDETSARNFGLKKPAAIAELNFKEILQLYLSYRNKKYLELPKYPPLVRDLAFVVDQKILYNDLKEEMKNFNELIKSVELFDVYSGANLGQNKKSLAFHIIYQSLERTLTSEEVATIQQELINHLKTKYEAQIRDF